MFALADCNSFYASCERVFRPHLQGKPVVVLSNNDGCVIARSAEAKPFVEMGAPYFKVKDVLDKHQIEAFSSNYTLYADMSRRVMQTMMRYIPQVEVYSIDEAFLDLRALDRDLHVFMEELREVVWQWTDIPLSIGVGPTKTLAKIANRYAKKQGENVWMAEKEADIRVALEALDVSEVWGIGGRNAKKLRVRGIETAWDLRNAPEPWILKNFTITGLRTVRELKGEPCIPLELAIPPKKGVIVSRSFRQPIQELEDLKVKVANYASVAGEKLRKQGSQAGMIQVFLRTNSFQKRDAQYRNSHVLSFPEATNYTPDLVHYALQALEAMYRTGYRYKKAGVMLSGIIPAGSHNGHLFQGKSEKTREKQDKVSKVMDQLNQRLGRKALMVGKANFDAFREQQSILSKRYTTSWEELWRIG